jgi:hypothetical protein
MCAVWSTIGIALLFIVDDIELTGSNPQDIQTMINIAYDFSQREGYSLQPTKSVILPVKTTNKISHEDETWTMNNNNNVMALL